MYGLSDDAVKSSDYIAGVSTTCLRLAHVIGPARPAYLLLGTEHCCYRTFYDVSN